MSSLGVPWHPQILADQLTLSQSGGTDYAHLITSGTPGFSYLLTALLGKDDPWLREEIENVQIFSFLHTSPVTATMSNKHVHKIFYLDEIKCVYV